MIINSRLLITLTTIIIILLSTVPASASPWHHILTTPLSQIKHSGIDFIKWKHPMWNVAILCQIGADLADAKTTADVIKNGGYETNSWLYGKKPSFARSATMSILISSGYAIVDHGMIDLSNRYNIPEGKYMSLFPQGFNIVNESLAAKHNVGLLDYIIENKHD